MHPAPILRRALGVLTLSLLLSGWTAATVVADDTDNPDTGASPMRAEGTFTVEITPEDNQTVDGTARGRSALTKTFTGDLVATGAGTMLTGMGQSPTSAAYVAIERVEGTLDGKSGGFMLVHRGVMTADGQDALITVVPDSGTGDLRGLDGTFHIDIVDGTHRYRFDYTLP
ncbi:MAG: DUF3224 domain-containing protein [Acidobacteriota bacterium]